MASTVRITQHPRRAMLTCRRTTALHSSGSSGERSAGLHKSRFVRRPNWRIFPVVLAGLRQHCPAAMPVVVRMSWLPSDTLGRCARRKSRFVVALNAAMNEHDAVDTLLHEWAHALSWHLVLDRLSQVLDSQADFEQASHDELWGCAYSRVWRAYIANILPSLDREATPRELLLGR